MGLRENHYQGLILNHLRLDKIYLELYCKDSNVNVFGINPLFSDGVVIGNSYDLKYSKNSTVSGISIDLIKELL